MRWTGRARLRWAAVVSAALLGLLQAPGWVPATTAAGVAAQRATAGQAAQQPGDGVLAAAYENGLTPEDQQMQAFLAQNRVLEDIADFTAERIALPQDVPLRATSCGESNAYWDPASQMITFCYELLEEMAPLYAAQQTEGTEQERSAQVDQDLIGLTNGVTLHELGHALVSLYDLPVVGKEEDAADQLSALLLASGDEQHVAYAISTINTLAALTDAEASGETPIEAYANEHSLSGQRYYNWVCWLYGSDTERYATVLQTEQNPDGVLPPERAQRCPDEFQQIDESWSTLLAPYLKT